MSSRRREAARREQAKRDKISTRGRCQWQRPRFLLVQLRGPRPSPAKRVGRGEEEQGSGRRDAHTWASRRERTLRRRGRGGPVSGQGRLLQPQEVIQIQIAKSGLRQCAGARFLCGWTVLRENSPVCGTGQGRRTGKGPGIGRACNMGLRSAQG